MNIQKGLMRMYKNISPKGSTRIVLPFDSKLCERPNPLIRKRDLALPPCYIVVASDAPRNATTLSVESTDRVYNNFLVLSARYPHKVYLITRVAEKEIDIRRMTKEGQRCRWKQGEKLIIVGESHPEDGVLVGDKTFGTGRKA